MNGWQRRALVALGVAVFCVAPMVGTADAATGWRSALKKEHSARVKRDRALEARIAEAEDAANGALLLLSCFQAMPTDVTDFVPPGAVDPIAAFTLSSNASPMVWTATIAEECLGDGSSSSARSRAFRAYFPKAAVR